jgi:hypothetical protein
VSNDGKLDLSLFIDILRTLEWNSGSQSSLPRGQKQGERMDCRLKASNRPTGWLRPTWPRVRWIRRLGV